MRQEAFRASVEQAGHPPVQDFITSRAKGPYADQEEDARQFLGSLPNPCAVFCVTDERAAQILGLAADCGCAVPEQLSVLGVDNDPLLCQIAHPSLSSIDTNASGAGLAVAERLDAMMHKRKLAPVQFVKPTGVVERVSTGMEAVDDPHLRRALAFMRRSIRKPLKVDDVAQAAGVSRRSLEYRFREQLQTSVAVFMRRQKVEEIKKLLLQTDYTLDKIAESVGIELQHLHALIHKVDGISPGKFRRANAKKAFDQIV
jgi:LacI family transcriptional regulator